MRSVVRVLALVLLVTCTVPVIPAVAQSDDDLEDAGFVDDGEWVGEVFDTEVTFDPDAWDPLADGTSGSFPREGYEAAVLISGDRIGLFQITVVEARSDVDDVDDFIDRRLDARRDVFPGTELVESGTDDDLSWFTFWVPSSDGDFAVIGEVLQDDDIYTVKELVVLPENVADLADLVDDTVELNGDSAFGDHYTARRLDRLEFPVADDEVEDDRERDEEDEDEDEKSGRAKTLWTGELYDAEISCTGDWALAKGSDWVNEENGVESASIVGDDGVLIVTMASAVDATLDDVMEVHADVIDGQYDWDDLDEVEADSDDATSWAGYTGSIDDTPQLMVVEAGWYDLDTEVVAIVQFISNADTFEDGFGDVYDDCTIDDAVPFTHWFPGNIDDVIDA